MKLKLKKHEVLPSAYVTNDSKYIIYKEPKSKRWACGVYMPSLKKYLKLKWEFRTLNDCKYYVKEQIDEQQIDEPLWKE